MVKRVMVAGLLGGIVLIVWTLVINGVLGLQARIDMNELPAERQVYDLLNEQIAEPGRYICNPQFTEERRFPEDEPVYSILCSGVGHESAGKLMLLGLAIFLATPTIAAALLAQSSPRVLASYPRKVLFFVSLGVLLALAGKVSDFGIGGYPLTEALLLALAQLVAWTVAGLVVAWIIKPPGTDAAGA
jgi:hypothetical protein